MERDGRESVFRAEERQTPTFEISSFSEAASSTQAAEPKHFDNKHKATQQCICHLVQCIKHKEMYACMGTPPILQGTRSNTN